MLIIPIILCNFFVPTPRISSKTNRINRKPWRNQVSCSCLPSLLYEDSRGRFGLSCWSLHSHVCLALHYTLINQYLCVCSSVVLFRKLVVSVGRLSWFVYHSWVIQVFFWCLSFLFFGTLFCGVKIKNNKFSSSYW